MRTDKDKHVQPASFVTDHLSLAAFLAARGHLTSVRAAGSKALFVFDASEQLSADATAFWSGTASVEPTCYDAARTRLRKQVEALVGGAR